MFIIDIRYTKPLEEVAVTTAEHRAYLQKFYDKGELLVSGRQNPPLGGLAISLATERGQVEAMIAGDPFKLKGLAEYRIIEFTPALYARGFQEFISTLQ